ncbi:MAG: hypothetical protein J6Q65_08210 [Lentisphaeria bacterium]|nr:hypothetical protein [Lentisphaeria bacterium]
MKKILFSLALLFAVAIPCRALDLILQNGDTLYNITHVTPLLTRVHLVSHPPGGNGDWGILIKTVQYSAIMPASLRDLQNYLVMRGKTLPPDVLAKLRAEAPAEKQTVQLTALLSRNDGTIGWAQTVGNAPIQLGRIFIRGLVIPRGSVWAGNAVPDGTVFQLENGSYPAYTLKTD